MIRRRPVDGLVALRSRGPTRMACLMLVSLLSGFTWPVLAIARTPSETIQREEAEVSDETGIVIRTEEDEESGSSTARNQSLVDSLSEALPPELDGWVEPERFAYSAQLILTMTLLGLIPAVMLMTTSYIRITIVLSLLRQAFGTQLLPLQVTTALAMFCTGLVMWPTWTIVHEHAVVPLIKGDESIDLRHLWDGGVRPVREFMIRQIDLNDNAEDVHLFVRQLSDRDNHPTSYDQVPMRALMPAFVLSELKTAFLIGFQIYLPFLVIDLVVAAVTTSMGMFMLPPAMISLPLKLLLFVMVDGWHLIVEMLLNSFH